MVDDTPDRIKTCRERLKRAARKHGGEWRQWTQDGVSKRMDVDLSTYQRWESGERLPDVAQLKKLALVFGLPLHELLGETPMIQSDNILLQFIAEMKSEIDRLTGEIESLKAENKIIKADRSRIKYRTFPEGHTDAVEDKNQSEEATSKRR